MTGALTPTHEPTTPPRLLSLDALLDYLEAGPLTPCDTFALEQFPSARFTVLDARTYAVDYPDGEREVWTRKV